MTDTPPPTRPAFIKHWREIQGGDVDHYPNSDELLTIDSPFSRVFGLTRVGIHHEVLPPGRRSSYPHAESLQEEFVYVLEGTPDAWINGTLHRLAPGDGVGFPPGTGICHTFINDTQETVRLLVVGETAAPGNQVFYPKNPDLEKTRPDWWHNPPPHPHGPHPGTPGVLGGK